MVKNLSKLAAAILIYTGFAFYLYLPYFKHFGKLEYLIVVSVCLGALGCYVLSNRWIAGFWARFFAGAIYGFGPFVLGLGKFHPTVGLLAASIPWLFCPAAIFYKYRKKWTTTVLALLPFIAIVFFFQVSSHYKFFAIPIQTRLSTSDMAGLSIPLVMAKRSLLVVGFYHVGLAPLIIGFSMLFAARRYGIMIVFLIGVILSFCNPFLNISPVIWLIIPLLCCSILIGEGMQGLVYAGYSDKTWVLCSAALLGMLSIVTLLLATRYFRVFAGLGDGYGNLLVKSAQMYIAGTIATAIIFFTAKANLHNHLVRWIVICTAMAIDIFFCSGFIVDNIF